MNRKKMIIVTSVILFIVAISLGILKLYNTYALSAYMDTSSNATYNITVKDDSSVTISANSSKDVFYEISNTSPGTVRYGVAYKTTSGITVKYYDNIGDSASGTIEENGKKYVKLKILNSNSTSKSVEISTVLGYSNGGDLIYDSDTLTLVTDSIKGNLTTYITNLYTNATKTTVTNNSITYNYATSVSLMNDRLGGNTTDYDGGNLRYYGSSPSNYIYFNCSDYSNQSSSTCEVWRIIGVFDGKVKIMRNSMLESLAWDQDKNINSSLTTYDNNWSTSSLQVLLNEKYYYGDTTGFITYYNGSTGTVENDLPLATLGIKNDTTRNLISEETYYLSGYSNASVYSDQMYNYERTTGNVYGDNPTSWSGKVALAYPSDYGYAADFNNCTKTLYNYSSCKTYNWMSSILGTSNHGWLLTPMSTSATKGYIVYSSGILNYNYYVYNGYGVVPVLSLDSTLILAGGTGTSTSPYQISV